MHRYNTLEDRLKSNSGLNASNIEILGAVMCRGQWVMLVHRERWHDKAQPIAANRTPSSLGDFPLQNSNRE
jgi:hypothetical protein